MAKADWGPAREVSNLTWPAAPYSTAHRPVQKQVRLLTGFTVAPGGWAAVHLPVHRTRVLDASTARLGVHAAQIANLAGVEVLDRLLLAARRQAVAIAANGLSEPLARLTHRLTAAGVSCPGLTGLLPEWLAAPSAPARAVAGHAQLLELDGMTLPASARLLVAEPDDFDLTNGDVDALLAELTIRAAGAAIAAAVATGRYTMPKGFSRCDVVGLLDADAGDLLPFTVVDVR